MSTLFPEIPYSLEALFAAGRITFWFVLLYGIIAPLFLSYTRKLPVIEKLIYSWVGLGGIITVAVMVLSLLHLYDFLSLTLTLLLIPLAVKIWRSKFTRVRDYFKDWEQKQVVHHIRLIEGGSERVWKSIRAKLRRLFSLRQIKNSEGFIVLGIAIIGAATRMYPALMNAAPFSRGWFLHLNRIKNMRLQDYFSGYPEPGGMHSLVSLFSMLTQVSPEMILHLLGALSSFFLCILIYWVCRDLTNNRYKVAPILGMAIYALVPLMFIPISLDQQVEASSVDIALCFALPTITIFIRNVRRKNESPWFYVWSGFIATAMTNLFICFVILLPVLLLGVLFLPKNKVLSLAPRLVIKVLIVTAAVSLPYIAAILHYGVDWQIFVLNQLYSLQSYSYYPLLIKPIEELSMIYSSVAGLMILYFIWTIWRGENNVSDTFIFLIIFGIISLAYTPLLNKWQFLSPGIDQLNGLYAVLIAIFAGIIFMVILEQIDRIWKPGREAFHIFSWSMLLAIIISLVFMQGGLKVSRLYPFTVPNGFFEAYYKIIDERLPYSYATVGPEINRITAKNRHFFMDYRFFLDEYNTIDSLYQQHIENPGSENTPAEIPPASIFIFTENPPYGSIQQGILYNSAAIMYRMNQWLVHFQQQENRTIKIFYSDHNTTVYEIVNREKESKIKSILNRTSVEITKRENEIHE